MTLVGLTAVGAPAALAQDAILPLNNWQVGGSLGVKKLNQDIQLPPGSKFNGGVNFTQGTIGGHTTIPDFTATVNLLGVLPNRIGLSITETAPATGTIHNNPDGSVTTQVTVSSDIRITSLRAGLLPVPVGRNCHTSSAVVLALKDTGAIDVIKGFAFQGIYTIPKLTGCGLMTPTLNLLMAGPNNPYSLTLKPPGAG